MSRVNLYPIFEDFRADIGFISVERMKVFVNVTLPSWSQIPLSSNCYQQFLFYMLFYVVFRRNRNLQRKSFSLSDLRSFIPPLDKYNYFFIDAQKLIISVVVYENKIYIHTFSLHITTIYVPLSALRNCDNSCLRKIR